MKKFGQIIKRNDEKGLVTVCFERPEACGKCGACGIGMQKGEVTLLSDCKIGNWVRVEFPEGRFVQATALVYIIPLAGLILGLLLGWKLGVASDLWMALVALCGLIFSLFVLFGIDHHVSKNAEWTPRITAVYADKPNIGDIGCGIS